MKFSKVIGMFTLTGVVIVAMMAIQSEAKSTRKLGLSSTLSPNSCIEIAADKFRDTVKEKSDGQIEIIRYPSCELFDAKSEIEAVSMGGVDMGMLHGAYVGSRSAILEFISSFGAVGVWESYDHYWRFIDQPEVREFVESEFKQKLNAKVLGIVSYGTSLVGNRVRPIKTVEDYKGIKMRASGKAQATLYKTLGAIPVEISSNEVFMALQRGTIDGAASGPSRFYFSKWYEVTPYITQDYTVPYLSFWLSINLKKWNSLSKKEQEILQTTGREIEVWTRNYVEKETETLYEKFKGGLVKEIYFMPQSERDRIRETVEPVMHKLALERIGAEKGAILWELLKKAR